MRYLTGLLVLLLSLTAVARPPIEITDPVVLHDIEMIGRMIIEAQEAGLQPLATDFKTTNYVLQFNLDADANPQLDGFAIIYAESKVNGLAAITLNLADLTVTSVTGDTTGAFTHSGEDLTITLDRGYNNGEAFELYIHYEGNPTAGMFFENDNGGIINTCGCPYDSKHWFPCHDMNYEKAPLFLRATVDDDYVFTSNGHLVSEINNGDGTKTWSFATDDPIAPYLIMLAASDFDTYEETFPSDSGVNIPVQYYVYQGDIADAQALFDPHVLDSMELFEDKYGNYPFERAGYHVGNLQYGGMEHQTCITIPNSLINGNDYYYSTVVHEMAHMWWGDAVTCETWAEVWLNEGFASYNEVIYDEAVSGDSGRRSRLSIHRARSINVATPMYDAPGIFVAVVYYKGSWVLNMLRHLMDVYGGTGNDDFFDSLKDYFTDNDNGTVTTEVLRDNCEDFWAGSPAHTDSDLDWFFDQWVYKGWHPEYQWYWWTTGSGANTVLHLQIDQVQTPSGTIPAVFEMPIDFEVDLSGGGSDIHTVWMDQRSQQFDIDLDDGVTGVTFDPGFWLFCEHEDHTAVEYANAEVASREEGLLVSWETEGDCVGVDVYRKLGIGEELLAVSLPSTGGYLDAVASEGTYDYRLVAHSSDGTRMEFFTGEIDWLRPGEPLALAEPYPNPAVDSVTVSFSLPVESVVELTAYDLAGRRIATLTSESYAAGRHAVEWTTSDLPTGVYLLRLNTSDTTLTKRIVISR